MNNLGFQNELIDSSYETYEEDKKLLDSIQNENDINKNITSNYSELAIDKANDILLQILQVKYTKEIIDDESSELVKKNIIVNPYNFDFNYYKTVLKYGSYSGYVDKYSGKGIRFSSSSKEKSLMIKIPINKLDDKYKNYISATIQFNILGKFNLTNVYNNSSKKVDENNTIYIGFKYLDKYWLLERGTKRNHLNWHYGTFQNGNLQLTGDEEVFQPIHQGGGNHDNMAINMEINKETNTVILKATNGTINIEWIVLNSTIPDMDKLEFVMYRDKINNEYKINDINSQTTLVMDSLTYDDTIETTKQDINNIDSDVGDKPKDSKVKDSQVKKTNDSKVKKTKDDRVHETGIKPADGDVTEPTSKPKSDDKLEEDGIEEVGTSTKSTSSITISTGVLLLLFIIYIVNRRYKGKKNT